MADDTKVLKVTRLPPDITTDKLKILFKNKRGQGGGPVDDVQLDSSNSSAKIIFQDSEAVKIILQRGSTVKIDEVVVQVEPYYENRKTAAAGTQDLQTAKNDQKSTVEENDESETSSDSSDTDSGGDSGQGQGKTNEHQAQKKQTSTLSKPRIKEEQGNKTSASVGNLSKKSDKPKNSSDKINLATSSESSLSDEDGGETTKAKHPPLSKLATTVSPSNPKLEKSKAKVSGHKPTLDKNFDERNVESDFSSSDGESVQSTDETKTNKQHRSKTAKTTDPELSKSPKNKDKGSGQIHTGNTPQNKVKKSCDSSSARDTSTSDIDQDKDKKRNRTKQQPPSSAVKQKKTDTESPVSAEGSKNKSKRDKKLTKDISDTSNPGSEADLEKQLFSETGDLTKMVRRTVKISIIDVTKSKDFYELLLEDEETGAGPYYNRLMMLDGLRKVLFVTFKNSKDAKEFTKIQHDGSSNFSGITIATLEDLDIYSNLISVHSRQPITDMGELKHRIRKQTGLKVVNTFQYSEERSIIIKFSADSCPRENIPAMTWKCAGDFMDQYLICAPVQKSRMILVEGIDEKISDDSLKRYFNNSRSGGRSGIIENLERKNPNSSIITLKSFEAACKIVDKQGHSLENKTLTVQHYFPSLTEEVYNKCFDPTFEPTADTLTEFSNTSEIQRKRNSDMEDKLDSKDADIYLLEQISYFDEINKKHSPIVVFPDKETKQIIISGDKSLRQKVKVEILQKCVDIKKQNLNDTNISMSKVEFLKRSKVQNYINEKCKDKGHICFIDGRENVFLYYFQSVNKQYACIDFINGEILENEINIDEDTLIFIQTKQAEEFFDTLNDETSLVIIPKQKKCITVVSVQEQFNNKLEAVKRFIRENKVHKAEILCSKEKQEFIKRFLSDKMNDVKNKIGELGVSLVEEPTKFVLKGAEDDVSKGEKLLSQISLSIKQENTRLKYFGIREFLCTEEGKQFLKEIEKGNKCLIKKKSTHDNSSDRSQQHSISLAIKIAYLPVNDCKIEFMQGDIFSIQADALISRVDSTGKCLGALGKTVISKGGMQIKSDLENKMSSSSDVVKTSAGNLKNVQTVFHIVWPKPGFDFDEVAALLKECLKQIAEQGIKSVVMPVLGIGKNVSFPKLKICNSILRTIKEHVQHSPHLQQIIICDASGEIIEDLIDRCSPELGEDPINVNDINEDASKSKDISSQHSKDKNSKSHHPDRNQHTDQQSHEKQSSRFGNIEIQIHKGVITKSRTDAIVTTIGGNLDLNNGMISKDVLRYGGSDIQQELRNNYPSGIKPGEFAESSGGNLKCKHIMYAYLQSYKGNNKQLTEVVKTILETAEKKNMTSIAFPTLGTGGLKYPARESAKGIAKAIGLFAKDKIKSLRKIDIIIYFKDSESEQVFKDVFSSSKNDEAESGIWSSVKGCAKSAYDSLKNVLGSGYNQTFGSVTLKIKSGDITEEKCDAIVNGINNAMDLQASGAVCKSILQKCGDEFQKECESKVSDIRESGLAVTSSGSLPCDKIFHLSMKKFGQHWDSGLKLVLEEAERQGVKSLAFPALGCSGRRADVHQIKKLLFRAIEQFGTHGKRTLTDLRLVIFNKELLDTFLPQNQATHKGAYAPRNQASSSAGVSEYAESTIFYESSKDVKEIIKKLNSECSRKFISDTVKKEDLKKLDSSQVKELEAFGLKHYVKVNIDTSECSVLLQGLQENVSIVKDKINDALMAAVKHHYTTIHQAVAVAIQWQFKDSHKWRNFEPILNAEIESGYKKKKPTLDVKDSKGRSYRIDFQNMTECLVDAHGNPQNKQLKIRRQDQTKEEPLPKRWSEMEDSENLKLVPLKPGSPEYKKVEDGFKKTSKKIIQIDRVQNKTLYQQYAAKRREIAGRNPEGHENEKRLYHGTNYNNVDQINLTGFSRNYSGANATVYGEGVYFATDPTYSVNYAGADSNGIKKMYQARVLVGESAVTKRGDRHPPNKPGKIYTYDSGTDGNGVMYIIFHDAQAYPEYMITFS
ncbi:protein mono-ADP-ribosyltransferase PARP14-like [Physella acuta]|uniref:protein mono-ADP-ribosyltransferase PARP14-like n=1 Tax=Physella acuta TaxID=109671 RepID=UPI0027DE8FB9|nr:protein mono-ADP-ribosyltransferase PARP14-like [Physella acuta]